MDLWHRGKGQWTRVVVSDPNPEWGGLCIVGVIDGIAEHPGMAWVEQEQVGELLERHRIDEHELRRDSVVAVESRCSHHRGWYGGDCCRAMINAASLRVRPDPTRFVLGGAR